MNTFVALALAAALSLATGFWAGVEWQQGREAIALEKARQELREQTDRANKVAITYAENTALFNRKLGDTRAQLSRLTTGRICLHADVVRMLNHDAGVPAATGEPTGAPAAAASDQDVADGIAICRGEHAKLAAQLNAILDIEDRKNVRH